MICILYFYAFKVEISRQISQIPLTKEIWQQKHANATTTARYMGIVVLIGQNREFKIKIRYFVAPGNAENLLLKLVIRWNLKHITI